MAGTDRGDADKKRMGTLHLLIQGAELGGRQPKPVLIFRGKGIRISQEERQKWDKGVEVMFQPKAWVDQNLANEWVLKSASKYMTPHKKHLIFMDNLNAQTNATFKRQSFCFVLSCSLVFNLLCIFSLLL